MRKSNDSIVFRVNINEEADIYDVQAIGPFEKQIFTSVCITIDLLKRYNVKDNKTVKILCNKISKTIYESLTGDNYEKMD